MTQATTTAVLTIQLLYGIFTTSKQNTNAEARPRERIDRGRFLPSSKKTLHSGSYEHRVPKKQNNTFFCMYVC